MSRYLQLGSLKDFQTEDYVMLIVMVCLILRTYLSIETVSDVRFTGLLHLPRRKHEYHRPSRYQLDATERYSPSHPRVDPISHPREQACVGGRAEHDHDPMGLQDLPATPLQQTHIRTRAAIRREGRGSLRGGELGSYGDSLPRNLVSTVPQLLGRPNTKRYSPLCLSM